MSQIKNLKITMIALAIAFTVGACGGGSSAAPAAETVVGLSTAENAQILTE